MLFTPLPPAREAPSPMGSETVAPPDDSSAVCALIEHGKECYICELGKPIATDLLLNTTSWTSILKLVLAVLHSSWDDKEYFSNSEITNFVFIHWKRISGSKTWSKEWKSRISDCLSHNKKSFESHERAKWRMKDMSQVSYLVDKLKKIHSTPMPLSPSSEVMPSSPCESPRSPSPSPSPLPSPSPSPSTSSRASPPFIRRTRGRKPAFEKRPSSPSPKSQERTYRFKEAKVYPDTKPTPNHHLSPAIVAQSFSSCPPASPSQPYPLSPALSSSQGAIQSPSLSLSSGLIEGMDVHRRRSSEIPPHTFGIPFLRLNEPPAESSPSSPIYLSPRTPSPPRSLPQSSYYPSQVLPTPPMYSYAQSYNPTPLNSHFINLPPPISPSSHAATESRYQPSSTYPSFSFNEPRFPAADSLTRERWSSYTHSVDRDMVDMFTRKHV